jgi:Flp pilus assembly protein TadB
MRVSMGLALGYVLTVGFSMVATFGITSASPDFVMTRDSRVTPGYKRLQALVWLVCVIAGAFVGGAASKGVYPWVVQVVMAMILIGMLWWNSWEARQRGMAHQILISLLTIVGVMGGYELAQRVLKF